MKQEKQSRTSSLNSLDQTPYHHDQDHDHLTL